ncbi:ABC transporter substrate-binding protein [Parafrankia sp. EUN1f]|uniref:ABC transporter substrate-binding protein n=1 Tax=Parafrankia sp. EUN1f TaxID=102897 RepID=UPI0001C459B7|nr:ABC transporter substrate-binding protein [Parafrankia sp. EUN1f]EFC86510.1 ABC-type branched-chain amino acid transport systems periplasmic component-like protein [Parafrankia sp. EUN1f]
MPGSSGGTGQRRSPRRRVGVRLAALGALGALSASLLLGACGGDEDTDSAAPADTAAAAQALGPVAQAKGEPVKIGVISDGHSPAADLSYEFKVADATVQYLNEHRSGVAGRPIEIVQCEAQADPAKATDCANQMIEKNVVAVVVGSSGAGEQIWEPLHAAHVPVMFYTANGAGSLGDPESTFILSDQFFPLITLPVKVAKDAGAKKVTVVAIDLPVTTGLYQVTRPIFEKQGVALDVVQIPAGTADMTPQMQRIVDGDPGIVQVVGSDAFCISAFNGLRAVGYDGPLAAIAHCITDATRAAVPGDFLKGMTITATAPIGSDDPAIAVFEAVVDTYGKDKGIDVTEAGAAAMFITLSAFQTGLEGLTGDITPATVTAALKGMPEKDLPGVTGLRFRCNGKAYRDSPAECARGGLLTTLDDKGKPTTYKAVGVTPIED